MDELDLLLRESLKHQLNNRKGKGTVTRLKVINEEVSTQYSNPENWLSAGRVILIHRAAGGEETSLGAFNQFFHRRTPARKLARLSDLDNLLSGTVETVTEYVTGDYWLEPFHTELHTEHNEASPGEDQAAIRNYLATLNQVEKKVKAKQPKITRSVSELLSELSGI